MCVARNHWTRNTSQHSQERMVQAPENDFKHWSFLLAFDQMVTTLNKIPCCRSMSAVAKGCQGASWYSSELCRAHDGCALWCGWWSFRLPLAPGNWSLDELQTFGTRNDQFHPVSQCFSVGTMGTPENEDLWRSMRNDSSYNDVYH